MGSKGIGSMNEVVDSENEEKDKKERDENLVLRKGVKGYWRWERKKEIVWGRDRGMKNWIDFMGFLGVR